MTTIEIPVVLRDRLRHRKAHPQQAYYEVIEDALGLWEEQGGWDAGVRWPRPWFGS